MYLLSKATVSSKVLKEQNFPKTIIDAVEAMERIKNAAISIKSPLEALTEELNNLQEAQMKALSPEAWELYQQEIERVQGEMAKFRGENKAGAKGTKESWQDAAMTIVR